MSGYDPFKKYFTKRGGEANGLGLEFSYLTFNGNNAIDNVHYRLGDMNSKWNNGVYSNIQKGVFPFFCRIILNFDLILSLVLCGVFQAAEKQAEKHCQSQA